MKAVVFALILDMVAQSRALAHAASQGWRVREIVCGEITERDKDGYVPCRFYLHVGREVYDLECPGVYAGVETACRRDG